MATLSVAVRKPKLKIRARLRADSDEALEKWDERLAFAVGVVMAILIVLAIFSAGAMVVKTYASETPLNQNPISSIFASRLMVTSARLAILAVGLYLVLSVLTHMRRGQWLTAAGPFKVSESLQRLTTRFKERGEQIRLLLGQNDRLRTRVNQLTDDLRSKERFLADAQRRLQKRE